MDSNIPEPIFTIFTKPTESNTAANDDTEIITIKNDKLCYFIREVPY